MNTSSLRFSLCSFGLPSTAKWLVRLLIFAFGIFYLSFNSVSAATFSGNARVEVSDSTGGLSWVPGNDALTVQCWFKLAIPSGTLLSDSMSILANRRSGTTNDTHGYAIVFDISSGDIVFSTRGSSGPFLRTLVEKAFQKRWCHIAVVRQGESFSAYVDGRSKFRNGLGGR